MQNELRYDLKITGNGNSSGGIFRDVKIMGDASIDGDLDILAFKCTGTARIAGNVKSTSCSIVGTVIIRGNVETGEAKITGKLDVDGNIKAKAIRSNGETLIKGGVAGEDVHLEGSFTVKGNCEAEKMSMKGIFTIEGLLNAGTVVMNVHSKCRVKEIGGEKIEIRRGSGSVFKRLIGYFYLPSDFFEGTLHADTIEGDDIYIEHTAANVIRGTNVVVGPGCSIGYVEYTGAFKKENGSSVTRHAQI